MFPTVCFEENKINCFPRDQSLSDLLYSWKFWSWKFIKPCCNGGCRSTCAVNSALPHSDVIDFAMLRAQRFWQETVSLLDVMWLRNNQWERALLGKISSYITIQEIKSCSLYSVCLLKKISGSLRSRGKSWRRLTRTEPALDLQIPSI